MRSFKVEPDIDGWVLKEQRAYKEERPDGSIVYGQRYETIGFAKFKWQLKSRAKHLSKDHEWFSC